MLTPLRPQKDDPRYREKCEQFKKDQAHKKEHPDVWGVLRADPKIDPQSKGALDQSGKASR